MALSCVDVYGPRLFATPYLELDRLHGTVRQNLLEAVRRQGFWHH